MALDMNGNFQNSTPLLRVYRGGILEKEHLGSLCVCDARGVVLQFCGEPCVATCPRSALKFVQAVPLLLHAGNEAFGLSRKEIAVTCASHNSELEHIRTVRSILSKAGVPESDLQCGTHPAIDIETRNQQILSGECLSDIHNNCSGKHAGFLALAKLLGAPAETYLDRGHPVQQEVADVVRDLSGMKESELLEAVDGCSAPQFGMPLAALATTFARLADAAQNTEGEWRRYSSAASLIVESLREHPYMIGGKHRFCTDLVNETKGLVIGKVGADGVYALMVPNQQIGLALKINDGGSLADVQPTVIVEALTRLGIISPDILQGYRSGPIRNCKGLEVGHVEAVVELRECGKHFREMYRPKVG